MSMVDPFRLVAALAAVLIVLLGPARAEDTRDWKAYSWGNEDLIEIGGGGLDCAIKRDRCLREQSAIDACFVEYCNLQQCYCLGADHYGGAKTKAEGATMVFDTGLVPACSPKAALHTACADKAEKAAAAERLDRDARADLERLTTPPANPPRAATGGFAAAGSGIWSIHVPEGRNIRFKVLRVSGLRQYMAVAGGGPGIPPDEWSGRARVDGAVGGGGEKPGDGTPVSFQMFHQRSGGSRYYASVQEAPREMGPGHFVLRAFNSLAARHATLLAEIGRMRGNPSFATLLAEREAELATFAGKTTDAYEMVVEITLEEGEPKGKVDDEFDARVPEPDPELAAVARTPLPGGAPRCGWDDKLKRKNEEPCWEFNDRDGLRVEKFRLADGTLVTRRISAGSMEVAWRQKRADKSEFAANLLLDQSGTVAEPRLDGKILRINIRSAPPGQPLRYREQHRWNADGRAKEGSIPAYADSSFLFLDEMCGGRQCQPGRVWQYDPTTKNLKYFSVYRHVLEKWIYRVEYDAKGEPCRSFRATFDDQGKEAWLTETWLNEARRCD